MRTGVSRRSLKVPLPPIGDDCGDVADDDDDDDDDDAAVKGRFWCLRPPMIILPPPSSEDFKDAWIVSGNRCWHDKDCRLPVDMNDDDNVAVAVYRRTLITLRSRRRFILQPIISVAMIVKKDAYCQ